MDTDRMLLYHQYTSSYITEYSRMSIVECIFSGIDDKN